MAADDCDSVSDESLRELVDILEPEIIQHLPEPSRLYPYIDVSLMPLGKLRFCLVCLSSASASHKQRVALHILN